MGGLTRRWDDIARIAEWFDESFEMQYQAGTISDTHMYLFLCIALQLKMKPPAELPEMIEVVKTAKSRRTVFLCEAWQAALAGDQAKFDKAFAGSLKKFVSKLSDAPNFLWWLAIEESAIWMIAERNGLTFPKLSDVCDAVVIRRETIGIA